MTSAAPQIFDRRLIRLRRARSAKRFSEFDFLHRRAMADVIDRLETVKRDFPRAVFAGAGAQADRLTPACGVETLIHLDAAPNRLGAAGLRLATEEETLPLATQSIDLFVSLLTLHGANDLVGALAQIRAALRPDGLFVAAAFGEETLSRLRNALYTAETEVTGGVSARIAPFATIQDFGQALARAGFAMPVVDVDKTEVRYETPARLVADLRGMGETGALANRPAPLRRDVFAKAAALFEIAGGTERFDIVYLTGWAPAPGQPKPLKPGSANRSLKDAVRKTAMR